jgi:mevalonate kinase
VAPKKPLTLDEEITRGKQAAQMCEDPILREALEECESVAVARWKAGATTQDREQAHALLQALTLLKDELNRIVQNGRMAEHKAKLTPKNS